MNEEISFCAECGVRLAAGDRFCPGCGAALGATPASPRAGAVERTPPPPETAEEAPAAQRTPALPAAGGEPARAAEAPLEGPRRRRRWWPWLLAAVAIVAGAIAAATALGLLPPIDWIPAIDAPPPAEAPSRAPPPDSVRQPVPAEPAADGLLPPGKAAAPSAPAAPGIGPAESLRIAEEFAQGSGGRTRDLGQAIEWYTRAARQGHAHAAWMLGRLLGFYGPTAGVPRDIDRALYWMNAAASAGHPEGAFAMGMFFSNPAQFGDRYAGQRDYNRAIQWLTLAARADHPIAPSQLAALHAELARHYADRARLEPSLQSRAQSHAREAQQWLEEAARRGDEQAQQQLRSEGRSW